MSSPVETTMSQPTPGSTKRLVLFTSAPMLQESIAQLARQIVSTGNPASTGSLVLPGQAFIYHGLTPLLGPPGAVPSLWYSQAAAVHPLCSQQRFRFPLFRENRAVGGGPASGGRMVLWIRTRTLESHRLRHLPVSPTDEQRQSRTISPFCNLSCP